MKNVRILVGVAVTVALLGPTLSFAKDPARRQAAIPRDVQGDVARAPCHVGFDVRTAPFFPPDTSISGNLNAAAVPLTKSCTGPVVGTFSSEVHPGDNGYVHIIMDALCIGPGGRPDPCTTGEIVSAEPGQTFFRNGDNGTNYQVHSMQMIWPPLKAGKWRFQVKARGDGSASLEYRTFTVQAY